MWEDMSYVPGPTPRRGPTPRTNSQDIYSKRAMLSRQHHSMDGGEGILGMDPLSVSTSHPPPGRAPLSNPITTTHSFWMNDGEVSSLEREYLQLKEDFQNTVEKLNQTMYSIKTFWSPELKRERQLRREEGARIAMLERMLAESDRPYQRMDRIDRTVELEDAIVRLQDSIKSKDDQIASLCMDGGGGRRAMDSAVRQLDDRNKRIMELEEEVNQLRISRISKPRDFTEKQATPHELVTLRMKLERSEVELSERKAELATCQTRLRNAEDELAELRAHSQLMKETSGNQQQHVVLLQGDVEALRSKLDMKNRSIEQKESRIEQLEKDLAAMRNSSSDERDNIRNLEQRHTQLLGRLEATENELREKESELERAKQRLAAQPDLLKERHLTAKIAEGERERQQLEKAIEEVRLAAEKEHKQQLETYQNELDRLKTTVANLEKELSDRDVLLESQNEKIGDMGRDLSNARKSIQDAMVDKDAEELRRELETSRNEVEKLLRILRTLEKENASVLSKYKQLVDEKGKRVDEAIRGVFPSANVKQRIQELEEALAESVSITAEREVHLSQQKKLQQQIASQLADARRENSELRRRLNEIGGDGHESIMKNIEAERKEHIEQLMALKQEALLSAIAEKDAHLAILERGGGPREEIETVRRHKEALMRKLKQENERRILIHPEGNSIVPVEIGGPSLPIAMPLSQPATRTEIDDADGIWA